MKRFLLLNLFFILSLCVYSQNQSWNPYLNQGIISPSPLLPLEFDGTGVCSLNFGNTGSSDLPLVLGDELLLSIILSNGVPDNVDPLLALSGSGLSCFNWIYNTGTKMYIGTQNKVFPGEMLENIFIAYRVTSNMPLANAGNGFIAILTPPDYTININSQDDDVVSSYTFVRATDFGDAPFSYGSASAEIDLFKDYMGNYERFVTIGDIIDYEIVYQASVLANGDDNTGIDDEDGVVIPVMMQGTTVIIPVLTTVSGGFGFLNAWMDWNGDGDFLDAGEQIASNIFVLSTQVTNLTVYIPVDAVVGSTFSRFRFGEPAGPTGFASFGEVEDYRLIISGADPSIDLVKIGTYQDNIPFGIYNAGDVIIYQFIVTNTGGVPLTNVTVTDSLAAVSGGPIAVLNVGDADNNTFSASYVLTQDDIDAGIFTNRAIANGFFNILPVSDFGDDVQTFTQTADIEILKEGLWNDENGDGYAQTGEMIMYSFAVTNTGNVIISGLEIDDSIIGVSNLVVIPQTLAPGQTGTATHNYTVTQANIDAGGIYNIAVATGLNPDGNAVTNESEDPTPMDENDPNYDPGCPDCTYTDLPNVAYAVLGDFVWHDLDGNGIQGPSEPGIPGVIVNLYNFAGIKVNTFVTDGAGYYLFTNIYPGEYFVEFIKPTEYSDYTMDEEGWDKSKDSDVNGSNGYGTTSWITLNSAEGNLNIAAGMYKCVEIGDLVWCDLNNNDMWENEENGINGLQVNLYRNYLGEWLLWDYTYTGIKPGTPSDDGYWHFCVIPGTYYVEIPIPPFGLALVLPKVGNDPYRDSDLTEVNGPGTNDVFTLPSGAKKLDIGAGYYLQACMTNFVWFDANSNGIKDANETGMEGVTVQTYKMGGQLIGTAVTDSEGFLYIGGLRNYAYYLKVTAPDGYTFTIPYANGQWDVINSDFDHSNGWGTTANYLLIPGECVDLACGLVLTALPLQFTAFWGEYRPDFNYMEWKTEREEHIGMLVIERQFESEDAFRQIGQVAAAGNSVKEQTYHLNDYDIPEDGVYYYRLNQLDQVGFSRYSKVIAIVVDRTKTIELSFYPNPARERFEIDMSLTHSAFVQVDMFDAQGKLVRTNIMNSELQKGRYTHVVELKGMPEGVYNIRIQIGDKMVNKKIVIMY